MNEGHEGERAGASGTSSSPSLSSRAERVSDRASDRVVWGHLSAGTDVVLEDSKLPG